ncbi:MAG: site-specific integrase, partial [Bryobacteraceae bacterium]|nr:site-specific integrase [Bryobacteraceae bacterium]
SPSDQKRPPRRRKGITVRRKRFQRGCVRKVKHGKRWVWIGKFYENGIGRTRVLGHCAEMTEGAALAKLQEYLRPVNETAGMRQGAPSNFEAYVKIVYLPQRRKKWKDSTDATTTQRIELHLIPAFERCELKDLTRDRLQTFLDKKAQAGLSRSVVSHLRWDLNAIFKMASEDALVQGNPAGSLVVPRSAKTAEKHTLTKEEVLTALSVLDVRERIIFLLAVLAGLRPGEIFALRWSKVKPEMVVVAERVYRGLRDDPKSERGKRKAALPPDLTKDMESWREISIDDSPDALVFPSEKGTYMSRDNFLRRNLQSKLEKVGLGWINFQVLRRTQASLSHEEGIDPKVSADQRGHAIGVAIDTYTTTDLLSRKRAVAQLEAALRRAREESMKSDGP